MNRYLIFSLFLMIHVSSFFSVFPEKMIAATAAGQWEAILFGCLLELFALWLYLKALAAFPGKNLVEICSETAGKWGTRIIVLPFVLFLFFYLILLVYYEATEIKAVVLPKTPLSATLFVFILLTAYAAWKGIHAIVRAGAALFFLFMPFVLFSLFISLENYDIRHAFPIWDPTASFLAKPDFYVGLLANSGFLILGMLPLDKPLQLRSILPVMLPVAAFGMLTVYAPLFIFGHETAKNLQYPALMASDTVDLEWVVFDWLPTFYVVSASSISVLQASVLLWMLSKLLRLLFLSVDEKWIVVGLSVVVTFLSLRISNVHRLNEYFALNSWFCLYSLVCIPIILAVLAKIGRRRAKA